MSRRTTYDVRIFTTRTYKGKKHTTHTVRWVVQGTSWQKTFQTAKLADGHRSMLVLASRNGEAFDVDTGLPVSLAPAAPDVTWLEHAIEFLTMKWNDASPKYRKSLAESLTFITPNLMSDGGRQPSLADIRRALFGWVFRQPGSTEEPPAELRDTIAWLHAHSRPIGDLTDPQVVRATLGALSMTLDGRRAADSTVARRRSAFHNCLEYAVERDRLTVNPLNGVKRRRLPPAPAIDRRRVVNPTQARALLTAVRESDPELVGFFATIYYAGPRPAEVLNLRRRDCTLPATGWGQLLLTSSYQRPGSSWTGSADPSEERQLKHRAIGDTRPVPAHPDLVATLIRHIETFGLGRDGRLFVARNGAAKLPVSGPYAKPVSVNTVYRAWHRARAAALTDDEFDSMLARRPYDLRHARLSTWLNAGVSPTQVAEWAGHSVAACCRSTQNAWTDKTRSPSDALRMR